MSLSNKEEEMKEGPEVGSVIIGENAKGLSNETNDSTFVRSASLLFPKTENLENCTQIPAFLTFTPFPANAKPKLVNCRKGDCPRCGTCKAYLSPFVPVTFETQCYRCPLCNRLNSTIHFTPLGDFTKHVPDRQELHNLVYDIIPSESIKYKRSKSRSFLLVVDEEMLNNDNFDKTMKMIDSLAFQENDLIGLITYSGSVTLYDINAKKSYAFPEYSPEVCKYSISQIHYQNQETIENLKTCLRSAKNDRYMPPAVFYEALQWVSFVINKNGGKIIVLSSGKITGDEISLKPILQQQMISVSVFTLQDNDLLRSFTYSTGGYYHHITEDNSHFDALTSLIIEPTAWDAATSLRFNSEGIKILSIQGPCYVENDCVIHPIVNQNTSITYILSVNPLQIKGDFIYQFAFRFTDDKGQRLIRVVNGKMSFADFMPVDIDEPSLALFALRQKFNSNSDFLYNHILKIIKQRIQLKPTSLLPAYLYYGNQKDKSFILSTTPTDFALTFNQSEINLKQNKFNLLSLENVHVIYPKPDDNQMSEIQLILQNNGFKLKPFYFPQSFEEYQSLFKDLSPAFSWYQSL